MRQIYKKRSIYVLFSIFINTYSYAQIDGKNILPSVEVFNDDVIYCESKDYSVILSGHYESGVFIEDTVVSPNHFSSTTYKADKPGQISEIMRYGLIGFMSSETALTYRLEAEYDNAGHIITLTYYMLPDNIDEVSLIRTFSYNQEGQLLGSVSKNSTPFNNSTITNTYYWSDGKVDSIITESNFGTHPTISKQFFIATDKNGSYEVQRSDGTIESVKEFNENGTLIRSEKKDDGVNCVTLYNEHGLLTYEETPEYDINNSVSIKKYTGYEYDSHGNWTKRITIHVVNGKDIPAVMTERTIKYSSM